MIVDEHTKTKELLGFVPSERDGRVFGVGGWVCVLCCLLYVVSFGGLFRVWGHEAALLGVIPVVLSGALLGLVGGLASSVFVVCASMAVLGGLGEGWLSYWTAHVGWMRVLLLFGMGLGVGRLRDLYRVRWQLQQGHIARLATAVEHAGDAIELLSSEGALLYVNPAWERATGYARDGVLGRSACTFLREESSGCSSLRDVLSTLSVSRVWRGELVNVDKTGEELTFAATISPVLGDGGEVVQYVVVKRDITQQKQQEQRLWHQAFHDTLTGLPNRALLLRRLERSLVRQRRRKDYHFAILFLDLDGFKGVNDTFGHDTGDVLLMRVGERLVETLRAVDTVARFGGDEFVVLLEEMNTALDAVRAAERVISCIEKPFDVDGHVVTISTSVGIAFGSEALHSPDLLVRAADESMYVAKQRRPGSYHVHGAIPKDTPIPRSI
jgi:diguanylate cyclase (GGDEF)-like protein/PAS domain S-box-containing protein